MFSHEQRAANSEQLTAMLVLSPNDMPSFDFLSRIGRAKADYIPCARIRIFPSYQVYDSLQAFSSSIAGLLASRAVLQGVGVGDASASPTVALLHSVLQDSMGRIATILFAHRLGTSLEPECKMYRLAADVLNDSALIFDCLSPALPKCLRVVVLAFSSVLRALCGVAAGSSKASLSSHFAKWGNLGELNAKDSSQETVISLLGMLVRKWGDTHIAGHLGMHAMANWRDYSAEASLSHTYPPLSQHGRLCCFSS
ncbi:DUF647 domain-containing protein [Histoplasma ohiense]|nr:DUF647 domain-containing protein [Histoplasma ohiense (nom. inval.)]